MDGCRGGRLAVNNEFSLVEPPPALHLSFIEGSQS